MTATRKTFLRELMALAWSLYRSDPGRTFADALAGAWRWTKARTQRQADNAAWLKRHRGGVAYGSLVASPIRRSLSGLPHAGDRFRTATRVTSMVGR